MGKLVETRAKEMTVAVPFIVIRCRHRDTPILRAEFVTPIVLNPVMPQQSARKRDILTRLGIPFKRSRSRSPNPKEDDESDRRAKRTMFVKSDLDTPAITAVPRVANRHRPPRQSRFGLPKLSEPRMQQRSTNLLVPIHLIPRK